MESARKIINTFLKTKYSPNELKGELFKVGEAAKEEGWTFMDASFQLGGKARDEGLSPDEVEQILRRAFSSEKRSSGTITCLRLPNYVSLPAFPGPVTTTGAPLSPVGKNGILLTETTSTWFWKHTDIGVMPREPGAFICGFFIWESL